MGLIARLNRERGIAVVVVTHDSAIARWASRTLYFFDGLVSAHAPEAA
jgi:ABC-type lipoprotein export system ATPase subunit